jgi:hypothetical protein
MPMQECIGLFFGVDRLKYRVGKICLLTAQCDCFHTVRQKHALLHKQLGKAFKRAGTRF